MPITIRPERPAEFPAIYALIETAFKTAQVSDGTEQDYTDKLRAGGGYVPELGLVAEESGTLLGHVLLTKMPLLRDSDGTSMDVLLVAPLSVVLEQRGKGIGAALMKAGLQRAAELGFGAAFLVGNPDYYQRFGFVASSSFGVRCSLVIPEQYVLGRELREGALAQCAGVIKVPV